MLTMMFTITGQQEGDLHLSHMQSGITRGVHYGLLHLHQHQIGRY